MPSWKRFKKALREIKTGDIVTRQKLILKISRYRYSTVDHYINCMKKIGVIETVKPGTYKIKRRISSDATINKVRDYAYGNDWKDWFTSHTLFDE